MLPTSSRSLPKQCLRPKYWLPRGKSSEITLTSDYGTSFTISMDPPEEREAENTAATPFAAKTAGGIYGSGRAEPRLTAVSEPEPLTATPDDHLAPPKPFKGYRKTCAFLSLLFLAACALFLRREAVALYPAAELWYNKIGLTGLDNPQYLKFEQIFVAETTENGKPAVSVRAVIKNGSVYTTVVPRITVAGTAETFAANRPKLEGGETAEASFVLPAPPPGTPLSLNIGFARTLTPHRLSEPRQRISRPTVSALCDATCN